MPAEKYYEPLRQYTPPEIAVVHGYLVANDIERETKMHHIPIYGARGDGDGMHVVLYGHGVYFWVLVPTDRVKFYEGKSDAR